MTETRWWTYLQTLMGDQTQQEAAVQIGISKSNITRWKAGARADPDFVVKAARAYGANILEALVEAEFITEEEAALTEVSPAIDITKIDAAVLAEELDRRIKVLNYLKNMYPDPPADLELGATVTDLASMRRSNISPANVGTVEDDDEAAIREANELRGAAQKRTDELVEPDSP